MAKPYSPGGAGRTVFTFSGFAARKTYEDGHSHGKVFDQGDRNNTFLEGRVRVGYEVTGVLTPFVEGVVTAASTIKARTTTASTGRATGRASASASPSIPSRS